MALPSVYNEEVTEEIATRINQLTPKTQPIWGTMTVSQMLAHCCVTYEYIFDERNDKPNFFMKFILKALIKNKVVSEEAYEKNSRTGPAFIITDSKDFEKEKTRLTNYIQKAFGKGEAFFDGKASNSFDALNTTEWNNMMYKHLDHHLKQFGV